MEPTSVHIGWLLGERPLVCGQPWVEQAMDLVDAVRAARDRVEREATRAIESLDKVAGLLQLGATADRLQQTRQKLLSDAFRLIVVGRFKNGKSTLVNALLGRDLIPVDDLPTTATLTTITYSDQPSVRAHRWDGRAEEWSLERYRRESTLRDTEAENRRIFSDIREFELRFPAELCRAGIDLVDTPGIADMPIRTEMTRRAVETCDAAIVVYRHDALAGQDERALASDLQLSGLKVFTVVNLMRGKLVDERLRTFIWDRLITNPGGPEYAGQDLAQEDIYFVDILKARQGRSAGRADLVAQSGLGLLERRLGAFLLRDRYSVHMERFVRQADLLGIELEEAIEQRRAVIQAQLTDLERRRQCIRQDVTQESASSGESEEWPFAYELEQLKIQHRDSARALAALDESSRAVAVGRGQLGFVAAAMRQVAKDDPPALTEETACAAIVAHENAGRPLRVFLCHSSDDKPAVRGLYRRLRAEGSIQPWLDQEDLLPGQDWQGEISRVVRTSDVVIVCLSGTSTSKTGFVQKEIRYALDVADEQPEGTIFLIPLRLEPCNVPERLSRWQWVDLYELEGYDRLMRSLRTRAESFAPG